MPYQLNAFLLSAVVLCALGAPVEDSPTDNPADEPSGEEEVGSSDLLSASPYWHSILGATRRHQKEFEDEFHNEVKYDFLAHYKISSLPARCPFSNFSMEACLHRLVQGMHIYTVLLRHVEKEYPSSLICSEAKSKISPLMNLLKENMRNPSQVTVLTSSQEVQLLKDLGNPDTFQRKMTAHSILRQLHYFLLNGRRAITNKEKTRGSVGSFQFL